MAFLPTAALFPPPLFFPPHHLLQEFPPLKEGSTREPGVALGSHSDSLANLGSPQLSGRG